MILLNKCIWIFLRKMLTNIIYLIMLITFLFFISKFIFIQALLANIYLWYIYQFNWILNSISFKILNFIINIFLLNLLLNLRLYCENVFRNVVVISHPINVIHLIIISRRKRKTFWGIKIIWTSHKFRLVNQLICRRFSYWRKFSIPWIIFNVWIHYYWIYLLSWKLNILLLIITYYLVFYFLIYLRFLFLRVILWLLLIFIISINNWVLMRFFCKVPLSHLLSVSFFFWIKWAFMTTLFSYLFFSIKLLIYWYLTLYNLWLNLMRIIMIFWIILRINYVIMRLIYHRIILKLKLLLRIRTTFICITIIILLEIILVYNLILISRHISILRMWNFTILWSKKTLILYNWASAGGIFYLIIAIWIALISSSSITKIRLLYLNFWRWQSTALLFFGSFTQRILSVETINLIAADHASCTLTSCSFMLRTINLSIQRIINIATI